MRQLWTRFRDPLRLIMRRRSVRSAPVSSLTTFTDPVAADVHRFRKSIAGHSYLIEATAVAQDRWRAYIVRIPGMPTALMPFYGRTADEAATQLSDWLTRAYQPAKGPAGPV
jgi:hypothetical protein